MSDEELLKHFEPMLNITRPDRQTAVVKRNEQQMQLINPQLAKGLALAKSLGIDVGSSVQYKKKR